MDKNKVIVMLVNFLINSLTPELLKQFVGVVVDFVESYVRGSSTKVDDFLILPICFLVRETFDIPPRRD